MSMSNGVNQASVCLLVGSFCTAFLPSALYGMASGGWLSISNRQPIHHIASESEPYKPSSYTNPYNPYRPLYCSMDPRRPCILEYMHAYIQSTPNPPPLTALVGCGGGVAACSAQVEGEGVHYTSSGHQAKWRAN